MDILYTPIRCAESAEVSFAASKHMPSTAVVLANACGHKVLPAKPSFNGSNLQKTCSNAFHWPSLVQSCSVPSFCQWATDILPHSRIPMTHLHRPTGSNVCCTYCTLPPCNKLCTVQGKRHVLVDAVAAWRFHHIRQSGSCA